MGCGVIVSDTQPEGINRYTWIKINSDGSQEWHEITDSGWQLVKSVPAPPSAEDIAAAIAIHTALSDAHHPANDGITGSRTVSGYKFTFTNGLLTGFEQV